MYVYILYIVQLYGIFFICLIVTNVFVNFVLCHIFRLVYDYIHRSECLIKNYRR